MINFSFTKNKAPFFLLFLSLFLSELSCSPTQNVLRLREEGLPLNQTSWLVDSGKADLQVGVADDFPIENDKATLKQLSRDIEVAQSLGAKFFRFGVSWLWIEEEQGVYQWHQLDALIDQMIQAGITPLPYLCYTPEWVAPKGEFFWKSPPLDPKAFGLFAGAIAKRYKNKVQTWELWNEPDNQDYWLGNARQFAEMVIEGAKQIRRVNPKAVVVLGGLAKERGPFVEELFKVHRVGQFIDVVNMHGYLGTWEEGEAHDYQERLKAIQELIEESGRPLDFWLAEIGSSSWRPQGQPVSPWVHQAPLWLHTPQGQAEMLWRSFVVADASQTVSLITWYRLHDLPKDQAVIGDHHNRHLGLVDLNGKPKPAFFAFQFYNKIFDGPTRNLSDQLSFKGSSHDHSHDHDHENDKAIYLFELANGDWLLTGWQKESSSPTLRLLEKEEFAVGLPLKKIKKIEAYNLSGHPLPPSKNSSWNFSQGWLRGLKFKKEEALIVRITPDSP